MWCRGGEGGALEPYEAAVSGQIEEAFQAFWRNSSNSPVFVLPGGGQGAPPPTPPSLGSHIDFRTLDEVSEKQRRPVRRCAAALPQGQQQAVLGGDVVWGHGQDPVKGNAFSEYAPEIAALLEESYAQHAAGAGHKGILFEGKNGVDYLVNFATMEQYRMQTRKVRPVFRHAACDGDRSSAGPPSRLAKGLSGRTAHSSADSQASTSAPSEFDAPPAPAGFMAGLGAPLGNRAGAAAPQAGRRAGCCSGGLALLLRGRARQ